VIDIVTIEIGTATAAHGRPEIVTTGHHIPRGRDRRSGDLARPQISATETEMVLQDLTLIGPDATPETARHLQARRLLQTNHISTRPEAAAGSEGEVVDEVTGAPIEAVAGRHSMIAEIDTYGAVLKRAGNGTEIARKENAWTDLPIQNLDATLEMIATEALVPSESCFAPKWKPALHRLRMVRRSRGTSRLRLLLRPPQPLAQCPTDQMRKAGLVG
jgi:hypothetical protein